MNTESLRELHQRHLKNIAGMNRSPKGYTYLGVPLEIMTRDELMQAFLAFGEYYRRTTDAKYEKYNYR